MKVKTSIKVDEELWEAFKERLGWERGKVSETLEELIRAYLQPPELQSQTVPEDLAEILGVHPFYLQDRRLYRVARVWVNYPLLFEMIVSGKDRETILNFFRENPEEFQRAIGMEKGYIDVYRFAAIFENFSKEFQISRDTRRESEYYTVLPHKILDELRIPRKTPQSITCLIPIPEIDRLIKVMRGLIESQRVEHLIVEDMKTIEIYFKLPEAQKVLDTVEELLEYHKLIPHTTNN